MKNDPSDPYVTKSMLDQRLEVFSEELSRKIVDEITEVIRDLSDRIDERFNQLETRIDTLEVKVDRLETKVDAIGFANQARDAQLTRHERWHFRTASKLGINLSPEV